MRELIPIIAVMNVAVDKERTSVDDHISKLIDEVLDNLQEQGFAYQDALDIATEHVLFIQYSHLGRRRAELQVEHTLKSLMRKNEFLD